MRCVHPLERVLLGLHVVPGIFVGLEQAIQQPHPVLCRVGPGEQVHVGDDLVLGRIGLEQLLMLSPEGGAPAVLVGPERERIRLGPGLVAMTSPGELERPPARCVGKLNRLCGRPGGF